MKILLTGGAGFIGYHLTRRLCEEGHEVVSVDNLNDYYDVKLKKDRLKQLEGLPGWEFHKLDILDHEALEALTKKKNVDAIIHLAALAGVRYSLDHGRDYVRTNIEGTFNILEIARHQKIAKLVYASSSSVYGPNVPMPWKETAKTEEPISIYAATKKADELLAYNYHSLFGVRSIGLRFFTVYGPWGRPDMALFLFLDSILQGKPIDVFNEGVMKRDFTYVDDIVAGIIAALSYETDFEVFNLGNGSQITLMEFIHTIEECLGMKAKMNLMPMQLGDIKESLADNTKAHTLLSYTPKTSVQEGVKNVVEWYRSYYKR